MKNEILLRLIIAMLVLGCDLETSPGIQTREIVNTPVNKLLLKTPRNYVTLGDSLELMFVGIQTSFLCTEITRLAVVSNDSHYLQPIVDIILPATIDECSLTPESGSDTLLIIYLSDFDVTDTVLNLANSSGQKTDSATLTKFLHKDTLQYYAITDSMVTDSTIEDSLFQVTDTIFLPCNEKLSYGGYCLNNLRDSLVLRLVTTVGWPADSCGAGIPLDVKDSFLKHLLPGSDKTCLNSLQDM